MSPASRVPLALENIMSELKCSAKLKNLLNLRLTQDEAKAHSLLKSTHFCR